MATTRRKFLKQSCLAAGAIAAGPRWLAAGMFNHQAAAESDTILVVIQMAGGNDWLNTVVPISGSEYSTYRAARKRVGLDASQTLKIDNDHGLHPNLTNLYSHLNGGRVAIVQGVGYEAPDLSHFNSMEIWHRADRSLSKRTGWLGDTLDFLYSQDTNGLHALTIGGDLPPAFESTQVSTTVFFDPEVFALAPHDYSMDDEIMRASIGMTLSPIGNKNMDFISNVGSVALRDSAAIRSASSSYVPSVAYPSGELAKGLKLVAASINANLGPRIYWVSQDADYDTHDSQRGAHDDALSALDLAIHAFQRDLEAHGKAQRVVTMVWSEFGRRVEDNASGGTDHGTSGGVILVGSRVRGGLFGSPPSLNNLDQDGNLRYTVDFRQVYASVLRNWLDADPVAILRGNYPTLGIV